MAEDEIVFDIEYKGYTTHIRYSFEDRLWYGQVEGIPDLVTFEAEDRVGFEKVFREAVEDYLAFCKDLNDSRHKQFI